MLKKFISTGLITTILSITLVHAENQTCFEENPALTKLGWVEENNHRITVAPNAYRHVEQRKIAMYFKNGKKNDFKLDIFNLADECHREDGLEVMKSSQVDDLSKIIGHISLDTLDEKMKLENMVFESGRKERRSLFGKKIVNDKKDSFQTIMYKTAQEKICNQKKYLTETLKNNSYKTNREYEIKSFEVGIKDIHCERDMVFPEDIYCDITYVRQLDIAPKK